MKINKIQEMVELIQSGFKYDDSGNDVTITGEFDYYDHNGNPDDHCDIYRLWDSPDSGNGVVIRVFDDRTIVEPFIKS